MESESNQREARPETQQSQESAAARRISEGIAEALKYGRAIDDDTAWLIARAITPGSGALHILATTGEIDPDIGSDLEVAHEVLPEFAETWVAALEGYCWRRLDKGPPSWWPQSGDQ
jgi:hypothetical protein